MISARGLSLAFAALCTAVDPWNMYTATAASDVAAAAATAMTSSPTSHVKGKAFDRVAFIWLENTDYSLASADPSLSALAKQGILLNHYFGVTHPSEPNYVASHGGDYFGIDNDAFNQINSNVSTIIDLLEAKGISWAEYQEDLPYSGFEGYQWQNQLTHANDYVRKHNPAVIYNNDCTVQRLSQMKNISTFHKDLAANKLPQWMFITPNMTSDGHDTSVTTAGAWTSNFLKPLLKNKKFMNNTLVVVTFDENETYSIQNNIFTILLGDAVPKELVGTTDSTYYNHYSQLATVQANWGLDTLGRWDVGANVYKFVADKTGDQVRRWKKNDSGSTYPAFGQMYFNQSYRGPFNTNTGPAPYPIPNTAAEHNGRKVFAPIVQKYGGLQNQTYYTANVEIPDGLHPPKGL